MARRVPNQNHFLRYAWVASSWVRFLLRGSWEGMGRHTFLFRTPTGNYFAQHQSSFPGERTQLMSLDQSNSMTLYEKLPNKEVIFEEAFPGMEIEDA